MLWSAVVSDVFGIFSMTTCELLFETPPSPLPE